MGSKEVDAIDSHLTKRPVVVGELLEEPLVDNFDIRKRSKSFAAPTNEVGQIMTHPLIGSWVGGMGSSYNQSDVSSTL